MWNEQRKCGMQMVCYGNTVKIFNAIQVLQFTGTYEQCVKWLKERACW